MACVYAAINATKREVYFGVAIDPPRRRKQHCARRTKTIAHWRCDNDQIRWKVLVCGPDRRAASKVSHRRERTERVPRGWTVHQTRGI